jgi:hypothetical protein
MTAVLVATLLSLAALEAVLMSAEEEPSKTY